MSWRTVNRAKKPAGAYSYRGGPENRWTWALRIDRDKLTKDPPKQPPDDPAKDANNAKDATNQLGLEPENSQECHPEPPPKHGNLGNLGNLGDADCANADAHRDRWTEHPDTGRPVCPICHPPAPKEPGS